MHRSAIISPCGSYRYELTRRWREGGQLAGWIMLNPSTADANVDDATIRRCISFSAAWGCAGMVVRNLFAFRSTDPRGLDTTIDPVGHRNDEFLRRCRRDTVTIVAWGRQGGERATDRARLVLASLTEAGVEPMCLGLTKDGFPRHPVRLPAATLPRPFPIPGRGEPIDPAQAALFVHKEDSTR